MNEAMKEINDEIKKVKEETNSDFEIEVTETTDEPVEEQKVEEEKPEQQEEEYSQRVERRIKKLVDQRREVELQANEL